MGYVKEKCRVCGDAATDWGYCQKHLDEHNERARERLSK